MNLVFHLQQPAGLVLAHFLEWYAGHLGNDLGDDFFVRGWLLVVMWVAFLAWLSVAVIDYRGGNTRFGRRLQVADLLVRYVLVAVLLALAVAAVLGPWLWRRFKGAQAQ